MTTDRGGRRSCSYSRRYNSALVLESSKTSFSSKTSNLNSSNNQRTLSCARFKQVSNGVHFIEISSERLSDWSDNIVAEAVIATVREESEEINSWIIELYSLLKIIFG